MGAGIFAAERVNIMERGRSLPSLGNALQAYHRLKSPTQSRRTAILQRRSQEIHGLPYGHSWGGGGLYPIVKAYLGPLPLGCEGVQFTTVLKPDVVFPTGLCYWRERCPAQAKSVLRAEDERAILSVVMPPLSTRYSCRSREIPG